jgi:hypothetical protein
MNRLILIGLILGSLGCNKVCDNEKCCIDKVKSSIDWLNATKTMTREDQNFMEIGIIVLCQKNHNDPVKALRGLGEEP